MKFEVESSLDALYAKRFGQKNERGYYKYTLDKKGKPRNLLTKKSTAFWHRLEPTDSRNYRR